MSVRDDAGYTPMKKLIIKAPEAALVSQSLQSVQVSNNVSECHFYTPHKQSLGCI